MKTTLALLLLFCLSGFAQNPSSAASNPFQTLSFLEGTWSATAQGNAGAAATGSYTFRLELANHVLARHSYTSACKGPADYNCEHGDLLYIYKQAGKLKAIYLDSEGHAIHYDVTTPEANTAVFLSDGSTPGPQFRLTYALKSERYVWEVSDADAGPDILENISGMEGFEEIAAMEESRAVDLQESRFWQNDLYRDELPTKWLQR